MNSIYVKLHWAVKKFGSNILKRKNLKQLALNSHDLAQDCDACIGVETSGQHMLK